MYRHFALLTLSEARQALEAIDRYDSDVLRKVYSDTAFGEDLRYVQRQRILSTLKRKLGTQARNGELPFGAYIAVLRRQREEVSFNFAFADIPKAVPPKPAAQQSWIVVETFTKEGEPVQGVRIDVITPDKRVHSLSSSDSGGARLDNIPSGTCRIILPELRGDGWRPWSGAGQIETSSQSDTQHVVTRGDSLANVARRYKLSGWKTLWESKENEPLRKARKHPSLVRPGDQVHIPGAKACEIQRSTDAVHRVVVEPELVQKPFRWSI